MPILHRTPIPISGGTLSLFHLRLQGLSTPLRHRLLISNAHTCLYCTYILKAQRRALVRTRALYWDNCDAEDELVCCGVPAAEVDRYGLSRSFGACQSE